MSRGMGGRVGGTETWDREGKRWAENRQRDRRRVDGGEG